MFHTILVATDGSRHGNHAVDIACKLAAQCSAALEIVHVLGEGDVPESIKHLVTAEHMVEPQRLESRNVADVSSGVAMMQAAGETGAQRYRMWAAIGQRVIHDATAAARSRHVESVHATVEEGDPARQILMRAEQVDADLIVLGRRGLSDLAGLVFGSVSHKLSQLADCAVLTVK